MGTPIWGYPRIRGLGYGTPIPWDQGSQGIGVWAYAPYPVTGVWGNGTTGTAANLAYGYARLATIPVVPVSYVAVWLLSISAQWLMASSEYGYMEYGLRRVHG